MLRFLFLIAILAVATYLLVRVFQQRGLIPDRPSLPQRPAPKKIVAPDDDEDFLRDLDRKRLNPEDPEGPDRA